MSNSAPSTKRPTIVCLCGSTRFWREFQEAGLRETLAGKIVLSIGCARCADDDDKSFGGYMPVGEFDRVKDALDELHLRKIDLADEVLILNVGGYIGQSTSRELAYAREHGKAVRFLENESLPDRIIRQALQPLVVTPPPAEEPEATCRENPDGTWTIDWGDTELTCTVEQMANQLGNAVRDIRRLRRQLAAAAPTAS